MKDMIKKIKFAKDASNEFSNAIQWHESVLMERENLIRDGKDEFVDWDQAKKEMRKLISLKSENRKFC